MPQVQTDGREQQRERNRNGNDQRTAYVTEKEKQNQCDQKNANGQVFKNRMRRQVQQVAAVEEGNYLHTRRQHLLVELLHLGVNAFKRRIRVLTLLQQHNAFHNVVVVDELAIIAPDRLLPCGLIIRRRVAAGKVS